MTEIGTTQVTANDRMCSTTELNTANITLHMLHIYFIIIRYYDWLTGISHHSEINIHF